MARNRNLMEREKAESVRNQAVLRQKRQVQGCIVGQCTVHCEENHLEALSDR